MSINLKSVVKKGKHFYEYNTGAFVKLKVTEDSLETPLSHTVKLKMELVKKLLPELKYYIIQGHNEIEIRKNEIFLRDAYFSHVTSEMTGFHMDYEDEDNLETFKNDELLAKRAKDLEEFCSKKDSNGKEKESPFFKPYTKLFTTNLDDTNEIVIKFVNKSDKEKSGKFLVQVTKTQVDNKQIQYIHKMNIASMKQLRKILK